MQKQGAECKHSQRRQQEPGTGPEDDNIIVASFYDAQSYQTHVRVCLLPCIFPGPPYLLLLDKRTLPPASVDIQAVSVISGKRRPDVGLRQLVPLANSSRFQHQMQKPDPRLLIRVQLFLTLLFAQHSLAVALNNGMLALSPSLP